MASQAAHAWDTVDISTAQRIAAGYAATPVPVDLTGKDPRQVGVGSYIVNTVGVCNHCHSANQYYQAGFPITTTNASAQTGNPYFLPTPLGPYAFPVMQRLDGGAVFQIDTTTFVAGGQNFGSVDSKNLTPDVNQNVSSYAPYSVVYAEGGLDWITYWAVLHNGVDVDQLFSQCGSGAPNGPNGCSKSPTNAALLQVMPWPTVRQLTDSDLNAVWQYLSSIPCTTNLANVNASVANTYGGGVLINNCLQPGNYRFYRYDDGKTVPVDPDSAGPIDSASEVASEPLTAQSANAQKRIQTAAGLSTPSCGLGSKPYPSCPLSLEDERIAEGFKINPAVLNMKGLDAKKVGIGSYWVNSAGNCDGCHGGVFTAVPGQFTPAENPANLPVSLGGTYTGKATYNGAIPYNPPATENPVAFLAGGNNFNRTGACDASGMGACGSTELLARNLTPDFETGRPLPEGNTLEHFVATLRNGHDFQKVGLNCPGPDCVTAPADGSKLQIMPWPALGSATDYDLESIYAYLSAIPCISNSSSPYPEVKHTCPEAKDSNYGTASYHKYGYAGGQVQRLD
jgi:hypothetical protein